MDSINRINYTTINKKIKFENKKEQPKATLKEKDSESNASYLKSNYNIAFHGLNLKQKNMQLDSKVREHDIKLEPYKEYLINSDDNIIVAGKEISLGSKEAKEIIKGIKKGDEIVFGRNNIVLDGMTTKTSRAHFKIRRNNNNLLLISDLGSTNGTTLKKNVATLDDETTKLESGKYYKLPTNFTLTLGDIRLTNEDLEEKLNKLKDRENITIGRSSSCDIQIKSMKVSKEHATIEKKGMDYFVKDLGSRNGTILKKENELDEITTLKNGDSKYISKDSELLLADEYEINLMDKNVRKLLHDKKRIVIGRKKDCDIVVPEFYSGVSRKHLLISENNNGFSVQDLSNKNITKIIPKNKIKPFPIGAENLEVKQGNVGDCYLLSTLYSLSRTENGKRLLENMIEMNNDGSFNVTFYNEKPIKINLEELNKQYYKGNVKQCVQGDLGVKLIERAYGKLVKSPYNKEKCTMFLNIDNGGYINDAMQILTGKNVETYDASLKSTENLFKSIKNNDENNIAIMCATPSKSIYGNYADKDGRFVTGHGYSICNIDTENNELTIKNPHNTKKSYTISFDEFRKCFRTIFVAKI